MAEPVNKDAAARPEDVALFRDAADVSPALWDDLDARGPAEAARASGAVEDGACLRLRFLGADYSVDPAARLIEGPGRVSFQKGMIILSYLAKAQDFGASGKLVPGRSLNGGEMFFAGPHKFAVEPLASKYACDPQGLLAKAESFGARPGEGGLTFTWRVLPHVEIGCVFHPADDEFGAELTWLFDSYSHFHLPLDCIWGLINVIVDDLSRD